MVSFPCPPQTRSSPSPVVLPSTGDRGNTRKGSPGGTLIDAGQDLGGVVRGNQVAQAITDGQHRLYVQGQGGNAVPRLGVQLQADDLRGRIIIDEDAGLALAGGNVMLPSGLQSPLKVNV